MKPWLKGGLSALAAAAALVIASEGLLTHAQPDIATGQPNICYGDTHDVQPGDTATPEECRRRLESQLAIAEAIVDRCYPPPPTPGVKGALIDLGYNVGPGKKGVKDGICVLRSGAWPTIRKRAHAGDWRGVCNGLPAWNRAGGRVYPGLVTRRANERELCLDGLP